MSRIHKSGAFAQQCFAVHPLCLTVKKFGAPDSLVLSCTSCHFQHHLKIRELTSQQSRSPSAPGTPKRHESETPIERLTGCTKTHPAALRVAAMDVVRDTAGLRCAECRMVYGIDLAAIETHEA